MLDYVRPVLSRWWIVVTVVAVVTVGTYVYYDGQTPVYKTSTRIFTSIDPSTLQSTNVPPGLLTLDTANAAAVLTSQRSARAIVPKLSYRTTAGELSANLTATVEDNSSFITITATRPNAAQAAELANVVAQQFIESRSASAQQKLTRYLEQLRRQIEALPVRESNATERASLASAIRAAKLQLALPLTSVVQVDAAPVPGVPLSPRPKRNAVFAFVLALLVAIALAYGLERFDRRVKRVEDAEDAYGLPLLAVLPHAKVPACFGDEGAVAVAPEFVEAFRQMRTNVQLGSLERPVRRILVTSAVPGEGKSLVARNLAVAYREFGRSVIVVDADLRKPTQDKLFGVSSDLGLSSILTGERRLSEVMIDVPVDTKSIETLAQIEAATAVAVGGRGAITDENTRGIGLILAGGRTANPQAVLASGAMGALLEQLQEQADVLIIDSPPVLAVSDALSLARDADAVILVSRIGLTTRDGGARAKETLNRVPDVRLAGIVVNDLSTLGSRYGYDYGYAHGRTYGAAE
ncbi:P-loop NTPase [Paraconexibacter sp.]|uniref:P-loop NTPase n=1 Tax=Paraconexibacter sp. TaxID=2949640 RepID=UPI003565E162